MHGYSRHKVTCSVIITHYFVATKEKKCQVDHVGNSSPSKSASTSRSSVSISTSESQLNKQTSQDVNPMCVALERNKRLQATLKSGIGQVGVIASVSPMNKWIIELRLWNSKLQVSQKRLHMQC